MGSDFMLAPHTLWSLPFPGEQYAGKMLLKVGLTVVMSQSHGALGSTATIALASFGGLRELMQPAAVAINKNAINTEMILLMKPPCF
jgi:hypothetical protein